jgi:hypothetical protein
LPILPRLKPKPLPDPQAVTKIRRYLSIFACISARSAPVIAVPAFESRGLQ